MTIEEANTKELSHKKLVAEAKYLLENSDYDWTVEECDSIVGPDLITVNERYYPDIPFAIVCSAGKPSSSIRKMNFFDDTDYSWVFCPQNLDDHRARRRFMLRLGVGYFNIFNSSKRTVTLNYNNTDAKIPVEHEYEPTESFESVDAIPYIQKQVERYENNTKAWRGGTEPDQSDFNL